MSVFYRIAYRLGFTPLERAAATHGHLIAALLDRERSEREPSGEPALDLGCGSGIWSVEMARRGWQVVGVDNVPTALSTARERARKAGVEARFVEGDVIALRDAGVGSGFRFLLDLGCFHGLNDAERRAMGREVNAVAVAGATLLTLVWAPGRRGPLPRGASREEILAAFAGWEVIGEDALDASALPRPLRNSDPRCYRLRRQAVA